MRVISFQSQNEWLKLRLQKCCPNGESDESQCTKNYVFELFPYAAIKRDKSIDERQTFGDVAISGKNFCELKQKTLTEVIEEIAVEDKRNMLRRLSGLPPDRPIMDHLKAVIEKRQNQNQEFDNLTSGMIRQTTDVYLPNRRYVREKPASESIERCLQYVKMGLGGRYISDKRKLAGESNYIQGKDEPGHCRVNPPNGARCPLGVRTDLAGEFGPWLEYEGFVNVLDIPEIREAMLDDSGKIANPLPGIAVYKGGCCGHIGVINKKDNVEWPNSRVRSECTNPNQDYVFVSDHCNDRAVDSYLDRTIDGFYINPRDIAVGGST